MTTRRTTMTTSSRRSLDADLLTSEEIEALIKVCSRRAPSGRRNRALIAVLWRSGLRLGEALALEVKDVDLARGTINVQRGKGGKRRIVGLDLQTSILIDQWPVSRKKLGIGASAPLFSTLHGTPLCQSYIRHLLPRLARKAGIERRVHAHGLRHAHAVALVDEGAPLYAIRDALGHSSVATTNIYLSRLGAGEAVEFVRSRTWGTA
jgi:site-specific recombinase XerD